MVAVSAVLLAESAVLAQAIVLTNSAPNPYRAIENWANLPEGRTWGSTNAVDIDRDGVSVWVAERCGSFAPHSMMKPGLPAQGSRTHEVRQAVERPVRPRLSLANRRAKPCPKMD
jgi:hypothetical protein